MSISSKIRRCCVDRLRSPPLCGLKVRSEKCQERPFGIRHSNTSSARASSCAGTSRPSELDESLFLAPTPLSHRKVEDEISRRERQSEEHHRVLHRTLLSLLDTPFPHKNIRTGREAAGTEPTRGNLASRRLHVRLKVDSRGGRALSRGCRLRRVAHYRRPASA